MRWVRTNRRAGGVLALFALFFQLAIGLTHVHGQAHTPAHVPAAVSTSLADAHLTASNEHRSHGPHSGIACDICILLHAAAVGDMTVPPALATPFAAPSPGLLAFATDRPGGAVRHFLPQSRAPPAAA